jgi:hypothetical protein
MRGRAWGADAIILKKSGFDEVEEDDAADVGAFRFS